MTRRRNPAPSTLAPQKVVASFDSASVLHAATAAAMRGETFPHLGNRPVAAGAVRAAGRLPWPILRAIYARIGGAEGIRPHLLGRVDLARVAAGFASGYPQRRYPGVLLGSSNGALTHLAAAMQTPWLPGTVLIPVRHRADPGRPDLALDFGRTVAPPLLRANPDIVLHQMHDAAQDELMAARMAYFRVKWREVPQGYLDFLDQRLQPGAPVILVEDSSGWPVVQVGERQLFQNGGRGGLSPEEYRERWPSPAPDREAPEAEWGAQPGFGAGIEQWCREHGHPLVRLVFDGPQAPSHAVATVIRQWYARLGRRTDRLIVPSFVLGDPWRTLQLGAVPFWTYFGVREALDSLAAHLSAVAHDPEFEQYAELLLLLFQHGAESPGYAGPADWRRLTERYGVDLRPLAIDERKSPHDIGLLGRYGAAMADLDADPHPWTPMNPADVLTGLAAAGGLTVNR